MDTWQSALSGRHDLNVYGSNRIGLFAIGLRFDVDDLISVAAEAITDGHDDKKCDLVYIDRDEQSAVVAQCYMAQNTSAAAAPANKASDLNTAVAWLLQTSIDKLPSRIQPAASELRQAFRDGVVSRLHVWYVHNLPESANVANELSVVETSAKTAVKTHFSGSEIDVFAQEVGAQTLTSWYNDSLSPILVADKFSVKVPEAFTVDADEWSALVTTIPAAFLYRVYKRHKTKLFSANVRDYLGSRRSDQNINHGIKATAEDDPSNFWVFNNGLTALVNNFVYERAKGLLSIEGLSIVNGAQTTGAIGSLKRTPVDVQVPIRFIRTSNQDVVYDIIRYNNSQNKVTASDFRSTDRIQKRLKDEMKKIPKAEYEGGRRGGHEDIIRRRANLLPSYTVGQALAAAHGDPVIAYNQKSDIWINDTLYSKYFGEDTSAAHIVFCYALLRAVEERKSELVLKSKERGGLTVADQKQLEFFRHRGSTHLFVAAVAACIETIVGGKVSNLFRVSFGSLDPATAQRHWRDLVLTMAPLSVHLADAFTDGLKNTDRVKKAIQTFQSLVEVTAAVNKEIYETFSARVVVR